MLHQDDALPNEVRDVWRRFNELDLHDSQLIGIQIAQEHGSRSAQVRMTLANVAYTSGLVSETRSATLSFSGCADMSLTIDFFNKSMVGDAIDSASCKFDAARIAQLAQDDPPRARTQGLDNLLVFSLLLVPISGEISLLAKAFDFAFESSPTRAGVP